MRIWDIEKRLAWAWLAGQVPRAAWHVSLDGQVSPLNAAARAMDPQVVANAAAALVSGNLQEALEREYDVFSLVENQGGGFVVVSNNEINFSERALVEAQRLWRLSPRQVEVLRQVCEGCEAAEIAKRLGFSWHTARGHVKALLEKSGCVSSVEMVGKLLKMG